MKGLNSATVMQCCHERVNTVENTKEKHTKTSMPWGPTYTGVKASVRCLEVSHRWGHSGAITKLKQTYNMAVTLCQITRYEKHGEMK